jgi:hypothetical protein
VLWLNVEHSVRSKNRLRSPRTQKRRVPTTSAILVAAINHLVGEKRGLPLPSLSNHFLTSIIISLTTESGISHVRHIHQSLWKTLYHSATFNFQLSSTYPFPIPSIYLVLGNPNLPRSSELAHPPLQDT